MTPPMKTDDLSRRLERSRWAGVPRHHLLLRSPCIRPLVTCLTVFLCGPANVCGDMDNLHESWRWVRFTTESGLPSDRVVDVVETSSGTPWANTYAGLAWYDGFRWHAVPSPQGVPAGPLSHIESDLNGAILAVEGGRLYRADRAGFTLIPAVWDGRQLRVGGAVPLDADNVLIAAAGWLYRYGDDGLLPFPMPSEPVRLRAPLIKLFRLETGAVWMGCGEGTFEWTRQRWVRRFKRSAMFVHADASGGILAVEHATDSNGLWTWTIEHPMQYERPPDKGPGVITALDATTQGDLLVTYTSGAVRVRSHGRWGWLSPVPAQLDQPRFVRFLRNGDLWVGGERGLFLYRSEASRWTGWYHPGPPAVNQVHSILKTRAGDVWTGTAEGVFIHRADGSVDHLTAVDGVHLGIVTGLAEDTDGGVWVSSGASFPGAFRWSGDTWRHYGRKDGLPAPRVHRIVPDRRGRLWFLGMAITPREWRGQDPGAFVYDGQRFVRWGTREGLPSGRVYAFAEGPDGALWFGTTRGLSRWKDGAWTHWTTDQGLRARRVFTLAIDSRGVPWFGHQYGGHGLGFLDEQERPRYFTVAADLAGNQVWDVRFGPDGALWIGTNGGLSRYRDGVFASFGSADGLDHPNVWPVLPLEDRVYVGTIGGGVFVLDLAESAHPPPLVVAASPLVDGQSVLCRWHTFAYHGEMLDSAVKTRFRFDDGAWSRWSTVRETMVPHLPAGRHTFTVQAKSLFGRVDEAGSVARFEVAPPFFRQPVFLAGAALWCGMLASMGTLYWRKRRRLAEQLRQSQKMEAVGTLAAGVAHDFYNLLTVILGYARVAHSLIPGDNQAHQALTGIEQAAHQATGVTRSLLTFSRSAVTVKKPEPLGALVENAAQMLRPMLPASIELTTDVSDAGALWVNADAAQLQQVILNLAINARDAMPDAGWIRVTARLERADSRDTARHIRGNRDVARHMRGNRDVAVLEVEDGGPGIAEPIRDRLFEPFFTTKARGQGTGLGLAVTHGIVTDHGGSIHVASRQGVGTRFTVRLPCCEPPAAGVSADSDDPLQRGDWTTVLLVEPDRQIQAIMAMTLESSRCRILRAADGDEALGLLRADPSSVRLVILDADLPGTGGASCVRQLRQLRPDLPAIMMSDGRPAGRDDNGAGDVVVLTKPFRMPELASLVRRILSREQALEPRHDTHVQPDSPG